MIAITTSNSISVNPSLERFMGDFKRMATVCCSAGCPKAALKNLPNDLGDRNTFFGYPKMFFWNIRNIRFDAMDSHPWDC